MRRGDYRNYYKVHMDRVKGRVNVGEGWGFSWGGVEGWGEKAHKCNFITIKNKKKEMKTYDHMKELYMHVHNSVLHNSQ